jgi:hypothetical protein
MYLFRDMYFTLLILIAILSDGVAISIAGRVQYSAELFPVAKEV